ncbi:hypothetical protein NFI96_007630 [Prochilodus magdalenae]|nr:hypothetical protein NFI96_007630 [Prochilodus magdalenae]
MNFLEVLVYLDDLIIFGKTLEEHEERLLKVLDRLKDEGLKLSLDKCQFGRTSVTYVDHIVSQDGIATDPSKIEAVSAWPKPQTLSELRSFLGFCEYYRRFVKDYSRIGRPLNDLIQGSSSHSRLTKAGKPVHSKVHIKSSKPFGSRWTVECDSMFEELKAKLTQTPVLAFADTQSVDASLDGLGGVLYQEHDNKLRPVALISRACLHLRKVRVRLSPEVDSRPVPSPRPHRQRKAKDPNISKPKTTEPSEDLECAIQSLSEYGCYAEGLVQNTQTEEERSREPIIESDHPPLDDVAAPLECDPLDTLPEAIVSSPVSEVEYSQVLQDSCGSFRVPGKARDCGAESSPGLTDSARLRALPGLSAALRASCSCGTALYPAGRTKTVFFGESQVSSVNRLSVPVSVPVPVTYLFLSPC